MIEKGTCNELEEHEGWSWEGGKSKRCTHGGEEEHTGGSSPVCGTSI